MSICDNGSGKGFLVVNDPRNERSKVCVLTPSQSLLHNHDNKCINLYNYFYYHNIHIMN